MALLLLMSLVCLLSIIAAACAISGDILGIVYPRAMRRSINLERMEMKVVSSF